MSLEEADDGQERSPEGSKRGTIVRTTHTWITWTCSARMLIFPLEAMSVQLGNTTHDTKTQVGGKYSY